MCVGDTVCVTLTKTPGEGDVYMTVVNIIEDVIHLRFKFHPKFASTYFTNVEYIFFINGTYRVADSALKAMRDP